MRKKAVSIKMLPERYKIAMVLVGHLTAQWWIQGRGTGPQAPWPPLFLNQNEAWRLKNVDPSPFIYLDDRASIFLSQGLDPALLLTPMGVACIFATCMTENRVCKNREWKIGSLGQSPPSKLTLISSIPNYMEIWIILIVEQKLWTKNCDVDSKLSLPVSVSKLACSRRSDSGERCTSLPSPPLLFIAFSTPHRSPLSERLEQAISKPKHHHLLWLYITTMNCGIPLRKFVMTPGCLVASVFFINLEPVLKGLGKWATSQIHIVFRRPVLRLKLPGSILLNTTQIQFSVINILSQTSRGKCL